MPGIAAHVDVPTPDGRSEADQRHWDALEQLLHGALPTTAPRVA